jgi:Family of unknown function (DUF6445)
MFNPDAQVATMRFDDRHVCHVIDEALLDPDGLVRFAGERRGDFQPLDQKGYPGICLPAPAHVTRALDLLFTRYLRRRFDARRTLKMHCRLSLVTTPAAELLPYQWLCHRDGVVIGPRESIQASVLYLFRDESLGGTSFYVPARQPAEIAALFSDSKSLAAQEFVRRHPIEPGYMHGSNAYFTCIGTVPAKWNRLIFYDGSMLHSGHIESPEKLRADPLQGRLTLNGFFTSRRNVV